ncbi:MAG TPA: Rieske 2Fe-2S domain-containing protein [Rhodocyclaceae bacterium]|jgi:nitrite reductase/ring-hydroxylating ferredoxin subunit|nr:Rieske 2Fe-2S domain-containing protein [Rhodocyclaceae bacterium]
MDTGKRLICRSGDLVDGGAGVRFEQRWQGELVPAFAIRHRGRVRAYLNRCAHVGVELDWMPGRFFDESGAFLICATHGALYRPDDGSCAGGPCRGANLVPLPVVEEEGEIFVTLQG